MESNIFPLHRWVKWGLEIVCNWPSAITVRVQAQVGQTGQPKLRYLPLALPASHNFSSSAEFTCRRFFFHYYFIFSSWEREAVVMALRCKEQQPRAKDAFQTKFTWNLKMNTLYTMEELRSARCLKIYTSLSFLFLVSLTFYITILRIGKWKEFFQFLFGMFDRKIMVLEVSEPPNWKRGCIFFSFFPFQILSLTFYIYQPCLVAVLSSFTKDHLLSRVGTERPTLHQRSSKIIGRPWGHRHQGKKRKEPEGGSRIHSEKGRWDPNAMAGVAQNEAERIQLWTCTVAFSLFLLS